MEYEILLDKKDEFWDENKGRIRREKEEKKKKEMKLRKYVKAPTKILVKARDLYVTSMNRLSNATASGVSVGHVSTLPRSFSANPNARSINLDKTMSELIRVASVRNVIITQTNPNPNPENYNVREPCTLMMRNEDKACDFVKRSKSYTVSKSNYVYALK